MNCSVTAGSYEISYPSKFYFISALIRNLSDDSMQAHLGAATAG